MPSKGQIFAGCTVALTTPFRDGEIDEEALRRQVEWQIQQGTPTLSPVGTTGESPTLSHDEHERVIATVVEAAAGRAKVLAGAGSNSTREAIRLTKFAARIGADGVLQVAPYYNRPTQEGMHQHFAAIAECSPLPMMLYNIPARTGRNIEPATIAKLARIPNIVSIKEASGSLDQASEILKSTDLTVVSGDDSLTLPLLSIGGEGVVSVIGNILPKDVMGLINAFRGGDIRAAQHMHMRMYSLCRDLLGLAVNPIPIKAALQLLGRGNGELRLPLVSLDSASTKALRNALADYGLISA